MATKEPAPKSASNTTTVIPDEIAELLGERPVLAYEDGDKFDALHAKLVVTYDPKDLIEHIWVRDIADLWWENLRLRGMRRAAIESGLPSAAVKLMSPEIRDGYEGIDDSVSDLEPYARDALRKAGRGDPELRRFFNMLMARANITYHMLSVSAYAKELPTIAALDVAIATADRRLDQVIRQLEARREANSTMSRSFGRGLTDIVDAKANEATAQPRTGS